MFVYHMTYYDDTDCKVLTEKGFVGASTYADAADKLVEYYGVENVVSCYLEELENILCFSDLQAILNSNDDKKKE